MKKESSRSDFSPVVMFIGFLFSVYVLYVIVISLTSWKLVIYEKGRGDVTHYTWENDWYIYMMLYIFVWIIWIWWMIDFIKEVFGKK